MTNVEILEQAMTFTTLNSLYKGFCNKLLEMPSNIDIDLTLISNEELTNIIDFLFTNYDVDEYHFEEVYDMKAKEEEEAYITADLQINESEYKEMENQSFLLECVDEDNFEITIDTQKKYDSYFALMPICLKEFYQYCEEFVNKKEKELDERLSKEFPKNEQTTTEKNPICEVNYRKMAEKFLNNYEFVTQTYENLREIVDGEQIIDVFEMIFENLNK